MVKINTTHIKNKIIVYNKKFYSGNPDVAELGDYTPFLYALGEKEWVKNQIELASKYIPTNDPPGGMEDQLLGLIEYYTDTKESWVLKILDDIHDYLVENYVSNGVISTPYFEWLNYGTKLANNPDKSNWVRRLAKFTSYFTNVLKKIKTPKLVFPRNGVFMELFVDLYTLTGNEKYLKSATQLADNYIQWDKFVEHGIFPSPHYLLGVGNEARIFKDNTGMVNGLITVYDKTKKTKYERAINKWIESVNVKCVKGPVYGRYNFRTKKSSSPKLFYSFPVIDLLCYAYHIMKNENYLKIAEGIADSWLEKHSKLGLFPLDYDGDFSHHDCMTDFTISLYRLWELTNERRFYTAYQKGLRGLFEHQGFNLNVDINTGKVVNENIVPRFVGLEGKAVILAESSEKIYDGDGRLFKLLRDR